MNDKFLPYIPLLIGILVFVFVGILIFFMSTPKKEKPQAEVTKIEDASRGEPKKVEILKHIYSLEALITQTKEFDLPKFNNEKILYVLNFEKDMIEYDIIKKLGKKAYEDLKNDR